MQGTWPIWLNPEPRTPGRALAVSLALHALVFSTVLLQLGSWESSQRRTEDGRRVTPIFLPARVPRRQAEARRHPSFPYPNTAASTPERVDREEEPAVSNEPRVDLNAMELSFVDDGQNELPDVVRSFDGVFALTDKRDPGFARYILEPPDWAMREVTLDVSGRLRFTLSPADKWTVLRDAARRYSLDLNNYDVSALFERPYAKCLQQAIRDRAMVADMGANRRVKSARLAFAAGRACGVEVVAVSTASTL